MNFCRNCGEELKPGMNVCPKCGTPINGGTNTQYNNGGAARPVVQNRSIAVAIILSIITCGIYSIVWFVGMVNDVNRVCNDEKSSQGGGTVFLLTLITCGIYGLVWFYQAGGRMSRAGQKYGMTISDNGVLYLVLMLFGLGIVDYCLLQSDLNQFSN